jgi:3-oxoacyl-(acyl-carrier-protein) synthase
MANEAIDYCLVVGAEEVDWLLCDAYHKWRLLRAEPPIEPFRQSPKGMILSEGAGAVLLGRRGQVEIEAVDPGANFSQRRQASELLARILSNLADEQCEIIIASANGTFVDLAESAAVLHEMPEAMVYAPKPAVGESVGASAIWQIIIAVQALRTKQLPPVLHLDGEIPLRFSGRPMTTLAERIIVLSCGLNQQMAGLRLSI